MRCKACGGEMKEGGAFAEIYRWCPRCEEADTEPMTEPNFRMITPTAVQWLPTDWEDLGDCE